ncbi:STAS domain-containing protein [Streptomyces tendae]
MDRAAAEHSKVVLDASGITFADSSRLNPLIPTHRTVDLRVAAPTRQLCRLLAITGVDALLTVRSTVEEAAACWAPRSAWPSSPYSGAGRCSPSARLSAPPFRPVASGYRPVGPGRWPGCRGQPEEGGAGVGLRAIATFDVSTGGGVGHGLATWFGAALAGPLRGRLEQEQEQEGTAFFLASTGPPNGCRARSTSPWPRAGKPCARNCCTNRRPRMCSICVSIWESRSSMYAVRPPGSVARTPRRSCCSARTAGASTTPGSAPARWSSWSPRWTP